MPLVRLEAGTGKGNSWFPVRARMRRATFRNGRSRQPLDATTVRLVASRGIDLAPASINSTFEAPDFGFLYRAGLSSDRVTRSPSRSPPGHVCGKERNRTVSTTVNKNQSKPLLPLDLRVHCLDPNRTTRTWINRQTANGIQEVVGSIPIGSTRLRSKLRFELRPGKPGR